MILPTKHMPQERALLTVGAHILKRLDRQKTVSAIWEETIAEYDKEPESNYKISYDWFVLALDLLFAIEAIEIRNGLLRRRALL